MRIRLKDAPSTHQGRTPLMTLFRVSPGELWNPNTSVRQLKQKNRGGKTQFSLIQAEMNTLLNRHIQYNMHLGNLKCLWKWIWSQHVVKSVKETKAATASVRFPPYCLFYFDRTADRLSAGWHYRKTHLFSLWASFIKKRMNRFRFSLQSQYTLGNENLSNKKLLYYPELRDCNALTSLSGCGFHRWHDQTANSCLLSSEIICCSM